MSSFIKVIDEALKTLVFTKFQTVMGLTSQNIGLVFEPKEVSLRKIAEKRGKDTVEFISLWRERISPDLSRTNAVLARKGLSLAYTDGTKSSVSTTKAIPVKIDYSLRFWSRSLERVTEAAETYLFWKFNNPNLIFNYDTDYPLEMDLVLPQNIEDESTILSQYNIGLYFLYSVNFSIDGWILTTPTTEKSILVIYLKVYTREIVDGSNYDTLIGEYTIESSETSSGE